MGYWLKKFADGTEIRGTDHAVENGFVSWKQTPVENMVGVELEHHGFLLEILGPGEFWQVDTYESTYPYARGVLIKRRIKRRIEMSDNTFRWLQDAKMLRVHFNNVTLLEGSRWMKIQPHMYGKWLVAEYDVRSRTIRHYIGS